MKTFENADNREYRGGVPLNLQLFAEGAPAGGDPTPAPVDSAPVAPTTPEPPVNPLRAGQGTQDPAAGDPNLDPQANPAQPPAPEQLILGKFKTVDDLAKSYQEAERRMTQQAQESAQMRQMLAQIQNQFQPQPQQPTPEELDQQQYEKLLENPIATIKEIVGLAVAPFQQQIQMQQAQAQVQEQLQLAAQKYPDLEAMAPAMQEILQSEQGQYLRSLPNVVDVLYSMAKVNQVKSPDDLLADADFRQRILADERIRNEIVKSHVQDVKQGQPPVGIGRQPGLPPATPPESPKTLRESTRLFWNSVRQGG